MNFIKSTKFAVLLVVLSVAVLAVMFTATDPQSARLTGLLVVIISLYGLCLGLILLISRLFRRKKPLPAVARASSAGSQRVAIAAVLALVPVLIILLNSLGTIGVVELALIAGFEAVLIFLIRKRQ